MPSNPDGIPHDKWVWEHRFTGARAASGSRGQTGTQGETGDKGKEGDAGGLRQATADWSMLAEKLTAPSLHLVLRSAQGDYLGGRLAAAHGKLRWLAALGAAATDGEIVAIGKNAAALLAQMQMGLDFFGHAPDYAPHVAYEVYSGLAGGWLPFVTRLESLRDAFLADYNDEEKQCAHVQAALESVRSAQERIGAAIEWTEKHEIPLLVMKSRELREEQLAAEEELRKSGEHYQKALLEKVQAEAGGDCDFPRILAVAAAVVPMAGSVWASAAGILTTIQGLADVSATIEGAGQVIAAVRAVEGDVSGIAGAFRKLSAAMPDAAPDTLKILVTQQDFERTTAEMRALVEQHLGAEHAAAYGAVVQRFLDIAAAGNKLVVMLNAAQARLAQLRADRLRREEELNRLKDERLMSDEGAAERLAFIVRAADDAKAHLLRAVYQEQKAYDYWALEHNPTTWLTFDAVALEDRHLELAEGVVDKAEARTQPLQRFRVDPPIVLDDAAAIPPSDPSPEAADWAERVANFLHGLRTAGRAEMRLPLDMPAFRNVRELLADRITLSIEGATTSDDRLHLTLTHHGDSTFRTRTGEVLSFSHQPRAMFIQYNLTTSPEATSSLGGVEGKYAYLSPFATWTIELKRGENFGLETANIRRVTISFDAFGTVPVS